MANKTIADYTAAVSIDGANDFLLIEPSGNTVYKKISRNVLLGLSSAPLGTTDSQSPTNKTFDNTNTITIKDTLFTLQDDGDTSKQAKFQLSGITTATTRTYTLPNASDTLAGIATAQTFTNKTITSPTITGGTIDNSTITVDSIAGHTSSTIVTIANLQISNGVLNSANAVTATSIADGAIQPKALVTGTGSGWAWSSFVPVFTNLTVGNGTLTARYIQTGKTVNVSVEFVLGNTSSISGSVTFTLPVTAKSYNTNTPLGISDYFSSAGGSFSMGAVWWNSTTSVILIVGNASSTYIIGNALSGSIPHSWTSTDKILVNFVYEAS